jgi:hypothetical protein
MWIDARMGERCFMNHEFTILASGPQPDEEALDRFYEAGCDDATISWCDGTLRFDFDREASHFTAAVYDAVKAVLRGGAKNVRVEIDADATIEAPPVAISTSILSKMAAEATS